MKIYQAIARAFVYLVYALLIIAAMTFFFAGMYELLFRVEMKTAMIYYMIATCLYGILLAFARYERSKLDVD